MYVQKCKFYSSCQDRLFQLFREQVELNLLGLGVETVLGFEQSFVLMRQMLYH
jgi:hypothetical protein